MSNSALLYFPRRHFSSRFGEKFFTFDITDYNNDDTYNEYHIYVYARYSYGCSNSCGTLTSPILFGRSLV